MQAIGRHIILEMWGCQNLNSVDTAERALREMVTALDVNLLDLKVYPFSPVGITGMAIVSESHLVIHTWPEYGYAAVDVFTCGAPREPEAAVAVLRRLFAPERIGVMEINRGQLDLPDRALDTPAPDHVEPAPTPPAKSANTSLRHGRTPTPAFSA
jgi:S-adenosylmethionine decarboxylase